ncbi:hypothetical protein MRX96_029905 [Rhipicephalus microplus]
MCGIGLCVIFGAAGSRKSCASSLRHGLAVPHMSITQRLALSPLSLLLGCLGDANLGEVDVTSRSASGARSVFACRISSGFESISRRHFLGAVVARLREMICWASVLELPPLGEWSA